MQKDLPAKLDSDTLRQLATEQLVEIIVEQAIAIDELKSRVVELETEIEKLKVSRNLDSKTSSQPPSGDILKKSEKKLEEKPGESEAAKRKPGGQPGHPGKTRKGFGRVDRFEILRPQVCSCCGYKEFSTELIKIETQQVAQLVERPIEIVEYHRHTCICSECGEAQTADWSADIVPGQDIGIKLQAFLGWINNYGHLPYEKQQELLWELGQIKNRGRNFAPTGVRLVLAARDAVRLTTLAADLPGQVLTVPTDITDPKQVDTLIAKTIAKFCQIDILVNAAGAGILKPYNSVEPADLDKMLDVNLKGSFYTTQAAAEEMQKRKSGHICNVVGILGKHSMGMAAAYSASKFGVVGFSKCMAEELKRFGIKFTLFYFGGVDSPFWDNVNLKVDRKKMLSPETAANAIFFALSAEPQAVPMEINIQPDSHLFF